MRAIRKTNGKTTCILNSVQYYEPLSDGIPDGIYCRRGDSILDKRARLKTQALACHTKRDNQIIETLEPKSSLKNPDKNYCFD